MSVSSLEDLESRGSDFQSSALVRMSDSRPIISELDPHRSFDKRGTELKPSVTSSTTDGVAHYMSANHATTRRCAVGDGCGTPTSEELQLTPTSQLTPASEFPGNLPSSTRELTPLPLQHTSSTGENNTLLYQPGSNCGVHLDPPRSHLNIPRAEPNKRMSSRRKTESPSKTSLNSIGEMSSLSSVERIMFTITEADDTLASRDDNSVRSTRLMNPKGSDEGHKPRTPVFTLNAGTPMSKSHGMGSVGGRKVSINSRPSKSYVGEGSTQRREGSVQRPERSVIRASDLSEGSDEAINVVTTDFGVTLNTYDISDLREKGLLEDEPVAPNLDAIQFSEQQAQGGEPLLALNSHLSLMNCTGKKQQDFKNEIKDLFDRESGLEGLLDAALADCDSSGRSESRNQSCVTASGEDVIVGGLGEPGLESSSPNVPSRRENVESTFESSYAEGVENDPSISQATAIDSDSIIRGNLPAGVAGSQPSSLTPVPENNQQTVSSFVQGSQPLLIPYAQGGQIEATQLQPFVGGTGILIGNPVYMVLSQTDGSLQYVTDRQGNIIPLGPKFEPKFSTGRETTNFARDSNLPGCRESNFRDSSDIRDSYLPGRETGEFRSYDGKILTDTYYGEQYIDEGANVVGRDFNRDTIDRYRGGTSGVECCSRGGGGVVSATTCYGSDIWSLSDQYGMGGLGMDERVGLLAGIKEAMEEVMDDHTDLDEGNTIDINSGAVKVDSLLRVTSSSLKTNAIPGLPTHPVVVENSMPNLIFYDSSSDDEDEIIVNNGTVQNKTNPEYCTRDGIDIVTNEKEKQGNSIYFENEEKMVGENVVVGGETEQQVLSSPTSRLLTVSETSEMKQGGGHTISKKTKWVLIGILIGVIVVAAIVGITIYFVMKKQMKKVEVASPVMLGSSSSGTTSGTIDDSGVSTGGEPSPLVIPPPNPTSVPPSSSAGYDSTGNYLTGNYRLSQAEEKMLFSETEKVISSAVGEVNSVYNSLEASKKIWTKGTTPMLLVDQNKILSDLPASIVDAQTQTLDELHLEVEAKISSLKSDVEEKIDVKFNQIDYADKHADKHHSVGSYEDLDETDKRHSVSDNSEKPMGGSVLEPESVPKGAFLGKVLREAGGVVVAGDTRRSRASNGKASSRAAAKAYLISIFENKVIERVRDASKLRYLAISLIRYLKLDLVMRQSLPVDGCQAKKLGAICELLNTGEKDTGKFWNNVQVMMDDLHKGITTEKLSEESMVDGLAKAAANLAKLTLELKNQFLKDSRILFKECATWTKKLSTKEGKPSGKPSGLLLGGKARITKPIEKGSITDGDAADSDLVDALPDSDLVKSDSEPASAAPSIAPVFTEESNCTAPVSITETTSIAPVFITALASIAPEFTTESTSTTPVSTTKSTSTSGDAYSTPAPNVVNSGSEAKVGGREKFIEKHSTRIRGLSQQITTVNEEMNTLRSRHLGREIGIEKVAGVAWLGCEGELSNLVTSKRFETLDLRILENLEPAIDLCKMEIDLLKLQESVAEEEANHGGAMEAMEKGTPGLFNDNDLLDASTIQETARKKVAVLKKQRKEYESRLHKLEKHPLKEELDNVKRQIKELKAHVEKKNGSWKSVIDKIHISARWKLVQHMKVLNDIVREKIFNGKSPTKKVPSKISVSPVDEKTAKSIWFTTSSIFKTYHWADKHGEEDTLPSSVPFAQLFKHLRDKLNAILFKNPRIDRVPFKDVASILEKLGTHGEPGRESEKSFGPSQRTLTWPATQQAQEFGIVFSKQILNIPEFFLPVSRNLRARTSSTDIRRPTYCSVFDLHYREVQYICTFLKREEEAGRLGDAEKIKC